MLIDDRPDVILGQVGAIPETERPAPGTVAFWDEVVPAAFRSQNSIGSIIAEEPGVPNRVQRIDPTFHPADHITGYELWAPRFAASNNAEEVAAIKRQIEQEISDRKTLEAAGWAGIAAEIAAGGIDPINLVPIGGTAVRSVKLGKNVLEGGLATARAGMIGASLSEALLHSSQQTRTLGESAANVAGATVLSGVLGGAAPVITRLFGRDLNKFAKEMEGYLASDLDPHAPIARLNPDGSVGAAAARTTTLNQEAVSGALGFEKLIKFQDPLIRTATSPSLEARRAVQQLAETPFYLDKNALGIATDIAAETRIKMWQAPLADGIADLEDAFVKYRMGREKRIGDIALTSIGDATGVSGKGKLSWQEFKEAVGMAMRRGDVHPIPEVAQAARQFRAKLFDPLKDDAINLKLLPEGVTPETAPSYLTRVYNVSKIIRERPQVQRVISDWLKRYHSDLSDSEIRNIADQIIEKITGAPAGRLPYEVVPLARGPLKERSFTIDDELIEPWLDSDVERIAKFYARTMSADIELARAFGSADMKDAIDKVRSEYSKLMNAAPNEKDRLALDRRMRRDIRDLEAMRDRIRGTYAAPSDPNGALPTIGRVVRGLNYVRLLGAQMLSAIPDLGRGVMVHGLTRTLGTTLSPLVGGLKTFKLAAHEAKMAGTALDMVLNTRALSFADMGDDFGRHNKVERGMEALTSNFGVTSLMAPWNAAIKQWVGAMSATRIAQETARWAAGGIQDGNKRYLAMLGIDVERARAIDAQIRKYGEKSGAVIAPRTDKWDDVYALEGFRAALAKDVDRMIVTPGQDKPLWMSTQVGKIVGQFKSFAFGSSQRVALAGLQQRDMAALNGMIMSVGLGMVRYGIGLWAAEKAVPDSVEEWIVEGVDRSGVTGWLFDANNIVEKVTRGGVGVKRLTGGQPMSRYASRNVVDALAGPTSGLIADMATSIGAAALGELSEADARAVRRLVPFQNLFYMRWLFDSLERGMAEELG